MFIGEKHKVESNEKNRIAHLGKVPWNKGMTGVQKASTETRKKISLATMGIKKSSETKIRMSLAQKGRICSEEAKQKLRVVNLGKKHSISTRLKISAFQKTKKLSSETRVKIAEANKGIKSHFWRGGITPINKALRNSIDFRLWREAVFARDNFTCKICKKRGGRLNPDHIKPFAYFPELRFAIDNGRTLCEPCHRNTDTYGGKINGKVRSDFIVV